MDNSILSWAGGSLSLTVYTTQASSGNQLNFRDTCVLTLTVNYAESTSSSTGSLNKTSVSIGEGITMTIYASAPSVSHSVVWSLGSYSSTTIAPPGGTLSSFIIPENWANAISGSSATAYATLYTYDSSGNFVGSYYCTFTVSLGGSTTPTIGNFYGNRIDGDVPADWGVYVQGKSKIQLVISGASASVGSSISSYRFSGGGYSWSSSTDIAYTTGVLATAGDNTFTGTVTDSRGLSASRSFSVNVVPYDAPKIISITTNRALENGTRSETGPFIQVRLTVAHSDIAGKNA